MSGRKSGRGIKILGALAGVSLLAGAFFAWPTKSIGMDGPTSHVTLGKGSATSVQALSHGGEVVVQGSLRTAFDGTVFDAAYRTDTTKTGPVTRPGGFYETDRAGLRVSSYDEKTHTVHLVASGMDAPACAAAGLVGPCLVPRGKDLAFERLLTQEEFAKSLSGSMEANVPAGPSLAVETPSHLLSYLSATGGLVLLAWLAAGAMRARKSTKIAQVRAAAKKADHATGDDVTLKELKKKVKTLVERAEHLDRTRVTLETRLATLDKHALLHKQRELAGGGEESKEVLHVIERELKEHDKLEADLRAANAGMERVLAALRVIPLTTRTDRNVRVKTDEQDPVDLALSELDMREEATEETERLVSKSAKS
jgi:hypothetical protein